MLQKQKITEKNYRISFFGRPGGLFTNHHTSPLKSTLRFCRVSIFLAEKAKKDFHCNPWRSARDVKGLALLSQRAKSRGDSRARNSPLKRPKNENINCFVIRVCLHDQLYYADCINKKKA